MLESQFIYRLILVAFSGIVYIYTMTKMASSNSAETTPQKHIVLKIIGSICLLLSVVDLIWGIYLLSQVQFAEQSNLYSFNEPGITNGYPTFEQSQIIRCITNSFSSLAWASFCFFFKKSNRKWWKKILTFICGVLLYVLYCSSTRFQDCEIIEMFAIFLFFIIAVICVVLSELQAEQQGMVGINTMLDQKDGKESESKEDDNRSMTRQEDCMQSESREDDSRFMPHQDDGMGSSPRTSSENEEESVNDIPEHFTCCDEKHIEVQEATNNNNDLPKYCRHCGKEVDYTNSRYCKYCGSELKP